MSSDIDRKLRVHRERIDSIDERILELMNQRIDAAKEIASIKNELDQLIDKMGFSLSSVKHIDNIKAPMPGLILEVSVTPGQEVKEDDPLLILEAMKMENVITSPRHGTIKGVSVTQGEAVQKNQLLIEFE